ncbi:MAG: hypothetical protein DRJ09_09100 [Bacteroidetes bacterium]|nr:MAG: hypothetical protein DRJ09_09100 [Bacteroidota bacterium]
MGIISKLGRYGGTYAHRDIAFEFGAAISSIINCTAKDWREANPELVKKGMNIRDIASINELTILSYIDSMNAEVIRKGITKNERCL